MPAFDNHGLSILIFFPMIWSIFGLWIPTEMSWGKTWIKGWAFLGSLITFVFSLWIYHQYAGDLPPMQFQEKIAWLPALGIYYAVGADSISFALLILTAFLMPLVILASFESVKFRIKEYYTFLLMLQTGMLGAFVATDLFLFYVFWESMLIPMYFLIGIWGGQERIYAAMKFFIYTLVGSMLMLVAIFYLSHQHFIQFGQYSTLLADLNRVILESDSGFLSPQYLCFLAFAIAFAIKIPLFPLHTWLPDAHVQAPTAGSVLLASILLKMGGYGFIRFAFPLFPQAVLYFQNPMMLLGSIAIVYGACVAWMQTDIKKLVAYSSVSHMGYVVLGLFSLNEIAVSGSIYQMLSHGISTGALFLLVGVLYERRHTRDIAAFGGLAKVMPFYTIVFAIVTLSSIALPGTNGFIGEFLILLGSWKVNPYLTALGGLGVILGAVYMLSLFQKVFLGENHFPENQELKDLTYREGIVFIPLLICVFFMGIFPNLFLTSMKPSIDQLLLKSVQIQGRVQR